MLERFSIRALLLTPRQELLLMRIEKPVTGERIWITPGGAREANETELDCLERELFEETGLRGATPGPHVWHRLHEFEWDGADVRQREHYYLVPVEPFEPTPVNMPDAGEIRVFRELRWWSLREIEGSSEVFVPRELARHLRSICDTGPPPAAIDVGI